MKEDKHAKEILLDFLKDEIEEKKEEQDETESQKFPILKTKDETESLKFPDPETEDEEMDEILENLEIICPVCRRVFKDVICLQRRIRRFHKMIHSRVKCNKWYLSKLLLEKHRITHEDYPYLQCPVCHLKYKRKAGLKYHHNRVHGNVVESKFTCDHCGKRFKLKIDLVGHRVCKVCGKIVKNITHHEWQHDKAAKRNPFEYSCDVCRKKILDS